MPTQAECLAHDAQPWLLEFDPDNPGVRYVALRGLLGRPNDDTEVCQPRAATMTTGPIPAILGAQHPDGYWARPGGVQHIRDKRDSQGRWTMERGLNGKMWADIEERGKSSKWITLRAICALTAATLLHKETARVKHSGQPSNPEMEPPRQPGGEAGCH